MLRWVCLGPARRVRKGRKRRRKRDPRKRPARRRSRPRPTPRARIRPDASALRAARGSITWRKSIASTSARVSLTVASRRACDPWCAGVAPLGSARTGSCWPGGRSGPASAPRSGARCRGRRISNDQGKEDPLIDQPERPRRITPEQEEDQADFGNEVRQAIGQPAAEDRRHRQAPRTTRLEPVEGQQRGGPDSLSAAIRASMGPRIQPPPSPDPYQGLSLGANISAHPDRWAVPAKTNHTIFAAFSENPLRHQQRQKQGQDRPGVPKRDRRVGVERNLLGDRQVFEQAPCVGGNVKLPPRQASPRGPVPAGSSRSARARPLADQR